MLSSLMKLVGVNGVRPEPCNNHLDEKRGPPPLHERPGYTTALPLIFRETKNTRYPFELLLTWSHGYWNLPGDTIKEGETEEQAFRRVIRVAFGENFPLQKIGERVNGGYLSQLTVGRQVGRRCQCDSNVEIPSSSRWVRADRDQERMPFVDDCIMDMTGVMGPREKLAWDGISITQAPDTLCIVYRSQFYDLLNRYGLQCVRDAQPQGTKDHIYSCAQGCHLMQVAETDYLHLWKRIDPLHQRRRM